MKRLITFICLILIIVAGYQLIRNGFENDTLNIASYETIQTKSEALTKQLASYNKRNQDDYNTAVSSLNSSIKTYNDSKQKYENIVEELGELLNKDDDEGNVIEEVIHSDKEKYKVDFLLVTLGDYSGKEGVDVVYQLTTSSTIDPNSTTLNYFLADLKFTVTGQYMAVTNFISDLENDTKLNWAISDFSMGNGSVNGYSGVTATFTVRDVPIDSESYLQSAGNPIGGENNTGDEANPDNTTTNPDGTVQEGSSTNTTTTATNTTSGTTNTVQ